MGYGIRKRNGYWMVDAVTSDNVRFFDTKEEARAFVELCLSGKATL